MMMVVSRTAAVAAMMIATRAGAQVSSTLQSITLTATVNQSVALTPPLPTAQAVNLVDRQPNPFPSPFTMTVSWNVMPSTATTVKVVAYFTTPGAAMVNGTDALPSSLIEASTDNGATWHPLNGNAVGGAGSNGGSYVLYTSPVTNGTDRKGQTALSFLLRINLTTAPATIAGTYTGIMTLIAICS